LSRLVGYDSRVANSPLLRSLNLEFLHAAAECVGVEVENLISSAAAFDDPLRLVKDLQNVAAFDFFQRGGSSTGSCSGAFVTTIPFTGGRVPLTAPAVVAGWLKSNAGNRLRSKVKTCPGESTIARWIPFCNSQC
jgi:hypothetical protein